MVYGPGQAYPPIVPAGTAPVMDPAWLAASADRERAVAVLRAGFAEGRLTQDELSDRVARAYASRTYGELWTLTADLPSGPLPVPHGFPYGPPVPLRPGTFDPNVQDVSPTAWRSNAALVITALVIFALAALVTLIVTVHTSTVTVTPFQAPAGPVQLQPDITHVGVARPVVPTPALSASS